MTEKTSADQRAGLRKTAEAAVIETHAGFCSQIAQRLHRLRAQTGAASEQQGADAVFMQNLRAAHRLAARQQFALLYPPLGEKGPSRVATILSKQTLAQQSLAQELRLDSLRSTQVG